MQLFLYLYSFYFIFRYLALYKGLVPKVLRLGPGIFIAFVTIAYQYTLWTLPSIFDI